MSELQTDAQEDLQPENIQEQDGLQTETAESGSELATDSEGQHETQGQESQVKNQQAVQDIINKKHGEKKQAERERDALQEQLKQMQEANQPQAPVVPDMPDEFDDNFQTKVAERDQAIQAKAVFDANLNVAQQQQQLQQQQLQQQHEKVVLEKLDVYKNKAKDVGINEVDLQNDANTVTAYGMRQDLSLAILGDTDGPLLAKYLALNPAVIEKVNGMNPFEFAIHVERVIRPEAVKFKPRTTNTPDPATNLSGNGADPEAGKYKHIKGATFE